MSFPLNQQPGAQTPSAPMPVVVKQAAQSKDTSKVFVLMRDDSGVGGSGFVFISRYMHLADNIRMTKEQFVEHFQSFNEVLMANDPRVGRSEADLQAAIRFIDVDRLAAEKKAQQEAEGAPAPVTLSGDASEAVLPKRPRGRPKGSKNKPKVPATT